MISNQKLHKTTIFLIMAFPQGNFWQLFILHSKERGSHSKDLQVKFYKNLYRMLTLKLFLLYENEVFINLIAGVLR